jgi:predicted NBD/HSP70 family sugar kinase
MSAAILAVDVGGTRYRAGLASGDDPAAVRTLGEWPVPAARDKFVATLESQLFEHGASRLGVGVPGLAEGTVCRWVPNLSYLDGLDLAALFPGVEVALGNDAQFALLAEASAGVAAGLSDAILLAIGTGIGSAVLADGRIVAGSRGGACSFGWAVADLADAVEDNNGWLERHSSGRALDRIAASLGLGAGVALVECARAGDARATAALLPPMAAIGAALAGAVALLDPAAIIFGGGLAASFDVLAPLIRPALMSRLPPHLRGVELRPARFGPRAGLVGAAFAGARGPGWRTRGHA